MMTPAAEAVVEMPPTEVVAKTKVRQQRTVAYKLQILEALDACQTPSEAGALLRREGLYSSLVSKWRQQRACGRLVLGQKPKRGPAAPLPTQTEWQRLQRENQRLKEKLERAELIIDVQKKVAQLAGTPPPAPSEPSA